MTTKNDKKDDESEDRKTGDSERVDTPEGLIEHYKESEGCRETADLMSKGASEFVPKDFNPPKLTGMLRFASTNKQKTHLTTQLTDATDQISSP